MPTELTLVWEDFSAAEHATAAPAVPTTEPAPVASPDSPSTADATSARHSHVDHPATLPSAVLAELAEIRAENGRRHNMMLVGGLVFAAAVLNYLDRLHSQIRSLEMARMRVR